MVSNFHQQNIWKLGGAIGYFRKGTKKRLLLSYKYVMLFLYCYCIVCIMYFYRSAVTKSCSKLSDWQRISQQPSERCTVGLTNYNERTFTQKYIVLSEPYVWTHVHDNKRPKHAYTCLGREHVQTAQVPAAVLAVGGYRRQRNAADYIQYQLNVVYEMLVRKAKFQKRLYCK